MGMTFENNNLTPAEQREQEKLEKARAKANENKSKYTSLGPIYLNGELVLLLVGEDKVWYKASYIKDVQIDPKNNSPKISTFDMEHITPIKKEELYSYFKGNES